MKEEEENINLIAIFYNFYKYKWSILSILFFTLIASFFYIKYIIPIYSSHTLIGIGSPKTSNIHLFSSNYVRTNIDKESLVDYEIKILNSRQIISKTLEKIDLSKQFFIQKKWKEKEIYEEEIPIKLTFKNKNLNKSSFNIFLEELDMKNFTLIIKNLSNQKEEKIYKAKYNQSIETKNYKIKINKKNVTSSLRGLKYKIIIETNENNLIARVSQNLSISQEVDSLLRINYEDTIPQRANDILTQLIISYEAYDLKVRQTKDIKNIVFLNKRIIEVENRLKEIGNKLKKYKLKHNELLIVGSEDKIFINTIERNRQIDLLSFKLEALKTTRKRIKNGIYSISLLENSNLQTTDLNQLIKKLREKNEHLRILYQQKNSLDTMIVNEVAYISLLKKFKDAKEKLQELKLEYTNYHPEVQKIKTDITLFQSELEQYLQKNIKKAKVETINLKEEIFKTIKILITSIEREHASIKKSLKNDSIKIGKLPNSIMKLEELKRTFKIHEKNYDKLLQKRSESLISKESTISNIQVIDKPTLPTSPIKPKKLFLYLSALIIGIIFSIMYTSIRIRINHSIHSQYDISINDYTVIHEDKEIKKSFWTLITHLEKLIPLEKSKVILVSANDYEENKSLTVHELSLKLSKISKKVLIIDFDIYNPNLTQLLNQDLSLGLSTLLSSKHLLSEIDVSTYIKQPMKEYRNVHLLPSGPVIPNGSALLFNSKVSLLLKILSKEYDYILIDTPPFGKYPEMNILLSYINIFLVVVKMGKTDKYFLKKLENREEENVKKIIVVT
jgi:capsular exopolysaccharide synthesis family protein